MPRCKPWSDEETNMLRDLWASMARRPEIVEQLQRSWPSIEGRAKALNLGRRPRDYVAVIKGEATARWRQNYAEFIAKNEGKAPKLMLNGWPKHNPPSIRARLRMAQGSARVCDAALPTEPIIPRSRIAQIQARAAVEG